MDGDERCSGKESRLCPPVVSVIIPTHNRAQLVGWAIRSVLSQTFQDFEIVVVDDASTDDTEQIVRAFADRRVVYVRREKNGGAAAARNSGIAAARGAYISFLDSDDEYLPTKLDEQVALLTRLDPRIGAVECGSVLVSGRAGEREQVIPPHLRGMRYEDFFTYERGVNVAPLLMRRGVAEVLRFEESAILEDWDFMRRLLRECEIAFIDKPLVVIRNLPVPRLATSVFLMRGLRQLIQRHSAELKSRPEVLARWHYRLAFFCARQGDLRGAREEFRHAVRLWPWNLVHWVLFAATLFGGGGYGAIFRMYAYIARVRRRLLLILGRTGVFVSSANRVGKRLRVI